MVRLFYHWLFNILFNILYFIYLSYICLYISQPIIVLHILFYVFRSPFELSLKSYRGKLTESWSLSALSLTVCQSKVEHLPCTRAKAHARDKHTIRLWNQRRRPDEATTTAAGVVFLSCTPTIRWTETGAHAVPIHKSSFTAR